MLLDRAVTFRIGQESGYEAQHMLDKGLDDLARQIRVELNTPTVILLPTAAADGRGKKVKKSEALAAGWGLGGTVWHAGEPS